MNYHDHCQIGNNREGTLYILDYIWYLYDYLKKTSVKTNVATDEDNSQNEIKHRANDEIGVAVQSLLWVRVELMAW